jgi:Na+/proline symporter
MNKKILKIIMLVLLCTELIVTLYVQASIYHRVMSTPMLTIPIISCLTLILFSFKHYNNKNQIIRVVTCNLLVLAIVPILLFCNKPKYTYAEAKNIIYKAEFKSREVKFIDEKANAIMTNSSNIFIDKAYVIKTYENNTIAEYVFDPINGSYSKIKN